MTAYTLSEVAKWVDGDVIGDASILISDAMPLSDAVTGALTLADNPKLLETLDKSFASAAVVPNNFPVGNKPLIAVANPHAAFETIVTRFRPGPAMNARGVHPAAIVHESATVGAGTFIDAGAVIGEHVTIGERCRIFGGVNIMAHSRIGNDCVIYPSATLYSSTIIEDRVLIHAGAVLGAFGFGYRQVNGVHQRTAQLGWVHIESDVEIGAGTTVDRGTYGATHIGQGTKIDNQVQIGHNCRIGKHNLICAQCGIAGSSSTGDYCVLAGQVGIKDHLHIADRAVIGAQAGVMQDVEAGETMLGSPAVPFKLAMVQFANLARLGELRKQVRVLQAQVDLLTRNETSEFFESESEEPRRVA